MGWLVDEIRSWFCKHKWELLQKTNVYKCGNIPSGFEWVYMQKVYEKKNH